MSSNEVSFQKTLYNYADLSTFGGRYSYANAINNFGEMVGNDTKNESGNSQKYSAPTSYAAIWSNAYYVPKTTLLAEVDSRAYGINNLSTIVGTSLKEGVAGYQLVATAWQNGEAHYLESLSNGQFKSVAKSINDKGIIVGDSYSGNSWNEHHATLWNEAGAIDLGTLGGKDSTATAINNTGIVVGWASGTELGDYMHPVMWAEGKIINLSPTHHGVASSVNDSGVVVGSIFDDEMYAHPMLWINQKEIALQANAGAYCYANTINNKNQIVGSEIASNGEFHAMLWNTPDSAPIDLNLYLDRSQLDAGWRLANATDINEQGWIVGTAINNKTYETHAFVLTANGITGLTGLASVEVVALAAPAISVTHESNADIWTGIY